MSTTTKSGSSTTSQTPTPQQIAYLFLQYARDDYTAIQNATGPLNVSGGSQNFTWDTPTQDYAAWCYAIELMCSVPVTISIPEGDSYTLSPYAPYNLITPSLLIGGSESIPPMTLVPFWLDDITSRRAYDPMYYGPTFGNVEDAAGFLVPDWEDDGSGVSTDAVLATALPVIPGTTYTNSGDSTVTQNYTFVWYSRINLGRQLYFRRMENLIGCVPMGDPASRPLLNLRVSQLIGNQPENNFLINASSGVTCVTNDSTASVVRAQWIGKTLDQLPPSLASGIPTPQVLMALEVDTNSGYSIPNAGQFAKLQIRTAMLYHKRFHVVVNDELPVTPDYNGLWYSDSQANARYAFDGQSNTLQSYYRMVQRNYGRYMPVGVVVSDFVGGYFPESPRETPYRGVVTPSVALAAMAGLKAYPAAQTVVRIPSGTDISSAYCTTYDFGVVPVAY